MTVARRITCTQGKEGKNKKKKNLPNEKERRERTTNYIVKMCTGAKKKEQTVAASSAHRFCPSGRSTL
jgi:hypothetical protein